MRLNETKRKQRTSQEEVLAELFAEAELQDSVRKKKNWDAWMESEVEQQIDEEIRKYLAESSDPTVYLTPKEAKAWNRMPKSKQQRLLQKESKQVFKEWQAGERKAFAGAERMICGKIWFFCSLAGFVWESKEREWQDRRGFGNQDACHGCRRNPRGRGMSVLFQRECRGNPEMRK